MYQIIFLHLKHLFRTVQISKHQYFTHLISAWSVHKEMYISSIERILPTWLEKSIDLSNTWSKNYFFFGSFKTEIRHSHSYTLMLDEQNYILFWVQYKLRDSWNEKCITSPLKHYSNLCLFANSISWLKWSRAVLCATV